MRAVFFRSAILLCALLTGCATVKSTISGIGMDNTPPPSPLVKFKQQVPVKGLWLISVGRSVDTDNLNLGPTLADNMIFTADPKGAVLATNPSKGTKIWGVNVKAPLTSGPTVGDGMVVVGSSDGKVVALNENNGTVLWRATVPNSVLAAPQIGQGFVIVKTIDGKLIALSAQSGKQLWLYDHGAPTLVLRRGDAPRIYGNKVIAGFSDGKIAAFSLDQGGILWEQSIGAPQGVSQVEQMVDFAADPIVSNGVIYAITYQGKVSALSINDGQIIWQQDVTSSGYAGMALGPRLLFVADSEDQLWAFDRVTGAIAWQQPQLGYRQLGVPGLMSNMLVVGDGQGYVHWLSQQDGHMLANRLVQSSDRVLAAPVTLGNALFVGTAKGHLSAWRVG